MPATGHVAAVAVVLACMSFATVPAMAEKVPAGDVLERAKQVLERARSDPTVPNHEPEAAKRSLGALKRHLVTIAATILDLETRLTAIEEALPRLEAEESEAASTSSRRRIEAAKLLAALQRLARRRPDGIVVGEHQPIDILRARLLLRTAMPALEDDARVLADRLRRLTSLRGRLSQTRREREEVFRRLAEERQVLAALVEIRSDRAARQDGAATAMRPRTDALAREFQTIEELIDRLARARQAAGLRPEDLVPAHPASTALAAAAEPLPDSAAAPVSRLPAAGPVVGRFGEFADNGWTVQGLTIRTRSSAQVVAPRAGSVVFAEPFLGYGELLIIDHGEGYHVLLAGLERLDARVGDELVPGEPIGIMGANAGTAVRLYIELRRGGRPLDPLPWLTETVTR